MYKQQFAFLFALALIAVPQLGAQEAPPPSQLEAGAESSEEQPAVWSWRPPPEVRANVRNSTHERFALRFPFGPDMLPVGQTQGFMETPDPGTHAELSVANLQLDLEHGAWFGARAKVHAIDKHRRNPTSSDRKIDVDELFLRFGPKPEFLERPDGTSFFLQVGKFPKMERQPTRLLESYGLAATAFNRFEDTQFLVGGTVGRGAYWRVQVANGNPLFFRDPNALAGDNGTPELRQKNPVPKFNSGFPILYNAESEDLLFNGEHLQFGQGLGYRWQRADGTLGFDAVAFHYRRTLADSANLTGTFYGGDLDLIDEVLPVLPRPLPLDGRKKEEWGGRVYAEWHAATGIFQFTKQSIAGLYREGWEGELGYTFNTPLGPLQSIQPAARLSGINNRFTGSALIYPSPSIWWNWSKIDAGVRIGFTRGLDLTVEYSTHNIGAPRKLHLRETLLTLRWRQG